MSTTAIAILNYNGKDFLEKFLPTLIKYSNNYPIYIGNNASTDNSAEFVSKNYPQIKFIELGDNFGYSKGYNLLLKEIESDYIALVNSDIEVTNNWLDPLIYQLDHNPNLAAIQPKIKSFINKANFEHAGAGGGFIDKYGYPFCRGRIINSIEKDEGQYDDSITISWASGACFLVRHSAFKQVGGFDDDFFAHMEEIDLCWRLYNHNFDLKYTSESTVYHVGGGTLAYESPFKTYLNYRNGLYLLVKNLPKHQLAKTLYIRYLIDWLSFIYLLLQGKWNHSNAIFKAYVKFFKTKKQFIAKRNSTIGRSGFTTNYSIIWYYFIKNKKKYNQF